MAFALGLVAFGAALWLLHRLKQRDLAACATVLGLAKTSSAVTRGTTAEGFAFVQSSVAHGMLLGHAARVLTRTVRDPMAARYRRRGGAFTVLELTLPAAVRVPIRLQPTGVLGTLEAFMRGTTKDRVAIDAAFDAAYTVYSADHAGAIVALTPDLRHKVLAFRATMAGNLPASAAGRFSSALMLGTFDVADAKATYAAFGTPSGAVAAHLHAAAPLLLDLAVAAGLPVASA